jgi:hypothetical protein
MSDAAKTNFRGSIQNLTSPRSSGVYRDMHCGTLPDFRRVPFQVLFHQSKTMKKLKALGLIPLTIIPLTMLLLGCSTTAPSPQSIQNKAKGIAYLVTAESLLQHPEWKPHFEIASYELSTLATSTNVGLNEITAIVTQLPTKKLKGERVQIYLTVGALFLQDEVAELSLTQPEELRRAVQGASEGIDLALKLAK